jgi:drug/metabolite transporter (DMT)-like permease
MHRPSAGHPPSGRALVLATLACVVAATCWAGNAIIASGAFARGVSPAELASARVVVAFVPLAVFVAVARRDLLRSPGAAIPWLVGFGACLVAVNFAYYEAINRVPVGVAISLQYTAPVLLVAGTALVARGATSAGTWIAAVLTLVGAVLVSGALTGSEGRTLDPAGIAAGIGSAISFGGYLLTAEAAGRRGAHPAQTLLIGFAVAIAIWAVVLPLWSWPVALLREWDVLWRVPAVGLIGTLLPFALTVSALRVLSSAVAGIATTTEPLLAAALAWLFLQQALTVTQLAGGALVVAGVLLAQVSRRGPGAGRAAAIDVAP